MPIASETQTTAAGSEAAGGAARAAREERVWGGSCLRQCFHRWTQLCRHRHRRTSKSSNALCCHCLRDQECSTRPLVSLQAPRPVASCSDLQRLDELHQPVSIFNN
nr:zinc finger protein 3 homolog isoform X3 [Kogia breviceps]